MVSGLLVGVLGGYGAVGRSAAARLAAAGLRVRLGGRDPAAAESAAAALPGSEGRAVDLRDAESAAAFCYGCAAVLNCAGPSRSTCAPAWSASWSAGASYVDAGGEPTSGRSSGSGRLSAVLGAGVMPGLSGLLPRWLARQGFDRATRLTAYVGGHGRRLTPSTAADFLMEVGDDRNPAGGSAPPAPGPPTGLAAGHFPGAATAYRYSGPEARRLAVALGLREVLWHNVFAGGHLLAALARLAAVDRPTGPAALAAAAADLAGAAELDRFGVAPYQVFVLTLDGEAGGRRVSRTLALRADDPAELTGSVAALAVEAVLAGDVPPGAGFADEVLPRAVVDRLAREPTVRSFRVFDTPDERADDFEGGVL